MKLEDDVMKKFNVDGRIRKDAKKELDKHNLNDYSGHSLEEATRALDDTILFTDEQIEAIKDETLSPEIEEKSAIK